MLMYIVEMLLYKFIDQFKISSRFSSKFQASVENLNIMVFAFQIPEKKYNFKNK